MEIRLCETLRFACVVPQSIMLIFMPRADLKVLPVRCIHRVHISIDDYWPFILDHLVTQGFVADPAEVQSTVQTSEVAEVQLGLP